MVGWYEIVGERVDPQGVGNVRLNTFYETRKKPLGWVLLKLLGVAAMVTVGYAVLVPLLPLSLIHSILVASGLMLIYVGLAFFIRPEPDGENMGFLGGLFNDPTHYSDNLNRLLWKAHCLLGPGRFISETILDVCTLVGLTKEMSVEEANAEAAAKQEAAEAKHVQQWRDEAQRRVAERQKERPGGQVELSSARFLDPDRFES
jgi:hypothetical protein